MRKLLWIFTIAILCFGKPIVLHEDVYIETVTICTEKESNNSQRVIEIKTLEQQCPYSDKEIELIALVTLAEAEGECEEGKRLVIDTILNRIDSPYFPDSVEDVIYQKNQFSSMWDDRYTRVTVTEDICDLVRDEIRSRKDANVIFFTADHYGQYGEPMYSIGNHYFSSYE